ncbi:MAG: hypothetical protein JNJ83_05685 [Verrucomicrobiaceae bacterium]|nr:hypothetical protein [Verrucomicrobiaceae bacterium]
MNHSYFVKSGKTCCYLATALSMLSAIPLEATPPRVVPAVPSGASSVANYHFGAALALSNKYLVVGVPEDDTQASDAGAVYLHHPSTGVLIRRIVLTGGLAGDRFGQAVAICGDRLVIGAPGRNGRTGAAYVFNPDNGKQLASLVPIVSLTGVCEMGSAVAIDNNTVIVGAPAYPNGANYGIVLTFQLSDYLPRGSINAPSAAGGRFGEAVAAASGVAIISAPEDGSAEGGVFVYRLENHWLLEVIEASSPSVGMHFGKSVAISHSTVVIGAPSESGAGAGAIYMQNLLSANLPAGMVNSLVRVESPDGQSGFGRNVAASGNLALVGGAASGDAYMIDLHANSITATLESGATRNYEGPVALFGTVGALAEPSADLVAMDSGAVWLVSPLMGRLPWAEHAAAGDIVGSNPRLLISNFQRVGIKQNGNLGWIHSTKGTDSKNGSVMGAQVSSEVIGLTGQVANGGSAPFFGKPLQLFLNQSLTPSADGDGTELLLSTLSGPGIASGNDHILAKFRGGPAEIVLREGTNLPSSVGIAPVLSGFREIQQSSHTSDILGVGMSLKKGIADVTASKDSAIALLDKNGEIESFFWEGSNVVSGLGTVTLGQFSGRLALPGSSLVFSVPLLTVTSGDQALFKEEANRAIRILHRKGGIASLPNRNWSAFLGETVDLVGNVAFRAVSTDGLSRHEGLWFQRAASSTAQLFLQDARLLRYQPSGDLAVMVLAQSSGGGFTAANDVSLFVHSFSAVGSGLASNRVLTEGDKIGTTDGARIGAFQTLDADPVNGWYVILVSLTSCTADSNQALFIGRGAERPFLKLRKGQWVRDDAGGAAKVASISIPATLADTTGAGGKGASHIINSSGQVALVIGYSDGYHQLVRLEAER